MNRQTMRHVVAAIAVVAGIVVLGGVSSVGALASGGNPGPTDPGYTPTLKQQTANWTPAQLATYSAKVKAAQNFGRSRPGGDIRYSCTQPCVPASYYARMTIIYEGSADCACGPATAAEMYSTYSYYFGQGSGQTLSAVETEMQNNGWYSCSVGTYRSGLQSEMNLHQSQNSYVWGAVGSGTDVYNDTAVDLGGYNFPVGYNGETYGADGYPLDNYQGVDWKHYFPAYGYDQYSNVYVADPHFDYNHAYTASAVYYFIDNFPSANVVLW